MTHPNCICLHCGTPFHVKPAVLARGWGKYCSRACKHAANSLTVPCAHCGTPFSVYRSRLAEGRGVYCSKACLRISQSPIYAPCPRCGKDVYQAPSVRAAGKTRYCSSQCEADTRRIPAVDRFWAKVTRTEPPEQCWLWSARTGTGGYGYFQPDGASTPQRTHIFAWRLVGNPIPEGWVIAHACDVPNCVRNDTVGTYEVDGIAYERHGHLYCAPQSANLRDMILKSRHKHNQSHDYEPTPVIL